VETDRLKRIVAREGALFVVLAFVGFVVLPVCIYLVGTIVFGAYEGGGLISFFSALQHEVRAGQPAVLFLLLSPWLLWQLVRLIFWSFHRLAPERGDARGLPEKL
jgi:hypothetical protein